MIRGLLILGLLILVGHLAAVFGGPVVENKMLEGKMKDVAEDRALRPEPEIRRELMDFIREKGIPLTEDQVVFQRQEKGYRIAARYHVTSKFFFYERSYEFYPASEEKARLRPFKKAATAGMR